MFTCQISFPQFQVVLAGAELGDSVDEVDSLLRKHENIERLTASQDEKITNLCEFGETLVENGHNESDMIKARVKAVCDRRSKLKEELGKRRNKLEDSKKIAQFYQDVVEVRVVKGQKTKSPYFTSVARNSHLTNKPEAESAPILLLPPLSLSPSVLRFTGIERRSVMSRYHGSTISG